MTGDAGQREARCRAELVASGALLSRRGLIRGREGNLSCRLDADTILLTPRGVDKGQLSAPDLLRLCLDGPVLGTASSELPLHRAIYHRCGDVAWVVHAHPVWTLSADAAGRRPRAELLAESRALLGEVVTVPPLAPGTDELADACAEALRRTPVVVLAGHGAVAVGASAAEALMRMELLDVVARVSLAVGELGP